MCGTDNTAKNGSQNRISVLLLLCDGSFGFLRGFTHQRAAAALGQNKTTETRTDGIERFPFSARNKLYILPHLRVVCDVDSLPVMWRLLLTKYISTCDVVVMLDDLLKS